MLMALHHLRIIIYCLMIGLLIALVSSTSAIAKTVESSNTYQLNRADEDYDYLCESAHRVDFWDPIKCTPLNAKASWYLSLGGEARERYEYFSHPRWGEGPAGSGYLLQRYFLHADLHMGEYTRLFTQLQSSLENGRVGGPRPTDRDELDLHQAFLDLKFNSGGDGSFVLRSGRQELAFGSQRIISVRDGPNVRQSFDGFRIIGRTGDIQLDGFASKPTETNRYAFDDGIENNRALWGLYLVFPLQSALKANMDLYYVGYDNREASFDQGSAHETRHSVGTRLWRAEKSIDYNFEFTYQWGSFGSSNIQAWAAESDTGYTFSSLPLHPRLGLKANITSGDKNPNNPDLQTFNPLFPLGAYFSRDNLISTTNQIDCNPSVTLHFTKNLSFEMNWDFLWRESLHDGIYNNAVVLVRSGKNSAARYIGSQPQAELKWKIDRHMTLIATYAHFFTGDFLRETGPAQDVDYVTTWIAYKF
jgi:hypothetical protein